MEIRKLNHSDVLDILPDRDIHAHKGDFGKILLLCGSKGYTGAAFLAATGALRAGAGLVYLGVPECIYQIEAIKLAEAIVFSLPEKDGKLSVDSLSILRDLWKKMDTILIGPGMGCNEDTFIITKTILQEFSGTVILDADGINVLANHIDILRGRTSPTILTPHAGEFSRIFEDNKHDRTSSAISFAKNTGSIVLLKGHETVVTDGQICYLNTTGNPGMAVGGSGDVLAGIVTALVGQKIPPVEATAAAAWIHGAAGDICADEIGQYGMLPTDMLKVLPRLLK